MFSRRAGWTLEPNEYSKLLESKRLAGAPVLDLTLSNPTRAGFKYPRELLAALADERGLVYEPSARGLPAAREAVAAEHSVTADRVMITASTSESYSYLFKLLCNPGDRVLVPRPSYPLFEFLGTLENVEIAQYSLVYNDGWRIDFDSVRRLRNARTRALLIVNPNNPTGSYVRKDEVAEIAALGLPVISDEVFHRYPIQEAADTDWSPVAAQSLLFQLSGLSKLAGLPQLKAGWIILDGPEAMRREADERLEFIADTFLSVSSPVQHALGTLLRGGIEVRAQIRQRIVTNLEWLRSVAAPLDVQGGWSAILRIPEHLEESALVLELLEEDDVLVQPGFFYDFEQDGYVVLSLLTGVDDFREGVHRLLRRCLLHPADEHDRRSDASV
ncbi:MAG TPA: pyridoxal phosphate-dependent aminotransferase [Bryobacteraceae bacterium]|nr:pyridoxal phosphate-dependent aminotransferase [Bryobacteraceae bacterium]